MGKGIGMTDSTDSPEPETPAEADVLEETPDLAQIEPAHILANDAGETLEAEGFTHDEILSWAETYVASMGGTADVGDFVDWIAEQET